MNKRLYVGNLPYSVTEATLRELFAGAGEISSATLITDRMTGNSKGFGFVEMSTDAEAQKAIETINGQEVDGRALTVAEARPPRDDRGGDRGRGGRGGDRGRSRGRSDRW